MKSKRLLFLLLLAIGLPWAAQAQDLADYTFSTGTDDTQWITLSDGLSSIVSSGDDKVSSLTDIGFSFPFGDGTYTKFWANSNGIFSFSSTPATSYNNQFTSSNLSSNQPKICGITRDMCVPSSGGYVKYELTGNAPSRVLVCEFYLGATSSASSATLKWQVQLHEAGSKVVIVYGEAPSSAPSSFQIGLSQSTSDIWTVNPSNHEATHATGAVSNTYNVWPGANRYYQFERPVWTCFKPINLGVSALSTTSATLTWEENGDATNWVLQYGTDSEFNTCTEVNVSNTPSFDATVTAGDTYYFRVKPDCDTDGSKWSNPFEFTVPCEAIAALSFDKGNLDSYTGISSTPSANNLPDCWSYINNCTYSSYKYYPVIYSSSTYAHSGSNSLRFYSYGYSSYDPQPQYAILPPMEDLAGKQVTLQARGYNASSTFKIGTMSNPMNVNTFHLITEQTGLTTSYQEFEYLIPSTCTDNYLVIMIEAATGYNYNGAYIDDIVIATPPTCIKPSSLDVTADGLDATFSWESDATQWQVAYSTSATANPDDNIAALVNTKSFTETLAIDNDYYFWVRTYCSETEQSMWAGPASVHIGYCNPAPIRVDNSGITNVTFGSGNYIVNNNTHSTTAPTYSNYSSQIGAVQAGVESTIAITYATGYSYNTYVWVDLNNDLSFDADEVICYGESTNSNPTTLTLTFTIPTTQALGDFRLRIGGADSGLGSDPANANPCYTGDYGIFEDYTLRVLEAPSCMMPTALALSRDNDQITATWEGTADTYNIDINGTVTNNVTSPYVFTAQLSTTYTVAVQANCPGDETSDWSNPKSITTPDCWNGRVIEYTLSDSYGDGWDGNPISAILVYEGCGNLVETLTVPAGSYSLSGTLALCGDYYEFVWQAGQYPGECSFTFTEGGTTIFTKPSNATDGMVLYTIGTQSCPAPTTLTAGTAEARSVALTWNENGEATAWQICLNGDEENLIEVVENVTINEGVVSYTLNGLTPDTDYTIKVRANCGEEQSCWSDEEDFSTIVACPVPTALEVSEEKIQEESAILTWVAGGEETAWNIQLATYNDANETWGDYVVIEENFNKTTYPIEGLTAGTTYRVQVQAVCGGVYDDMSEWSEYAQFTTVATCVAPTNLAVTPDSETAFGATVTWEGTNDSYILEYSKAITPDSEVNTTYDFENGTQGWTTIDADGHGDAWSRNNSTSDAHNSSYSMRAKYNSSHAHQDYLVSPQIPLGGTFSFYAKKGGSYNDTFRVYLSTTGNTNTSDFSIELTDGDVLPTQTYELYTYDLSSYSGTGYVAIVYTALADQYYLYIDDVNVTASIEGEYGAWQTVENATSPYTFVDELDPESMYKVRVKGVCGSSQSQYSNVVKFTTLEACPAPTNFTLGEVTGNSAAFSWTQPTNGVEINEWVVKYRKSGETEYLTLTPNPTTPSATIEGLDASTEYEVVIAPACNEEKTLEDEFDTPCAIHTLPYTYGFEDAAEFDCWTMTNCVNGTGINTSAKRTDNNGFSFYYVSNSQQCLISPEFNCTTEMGVSFYYKNSSTSFDETFHVGYSTTTNDVDAFTWGDEILVDKANTSWLVYTNIFPAGTKFVAIKHTSDNAFYLYLDDFTFAEPISLTKEIEPYTGEKDNYYLIASPLAYDVDPTTIEGMTEVDYDLYYFDQTQNLEWRNHKDTEVGGYKLINGKGYLYANNTGNDITFAGVPYVGNGTVTLTKTENAEWSGWNLVGNPFSTTATIERGFYRMNEETGDEIIPGSGEINVMEGVFVEAESNGETMTFTGVVEVNNDQVMAINLNMDNILLDRAMVYFGGERKLSKFQLNPNHTKVYIPMDGKDFAVVSAGKVGEMPVSFKAEKNGSYTLSFTSQEVSFSYLHLIDNMTGEDVNLLANPSYSFDALTTDYESRFRLVFATGSSVDGDSFGFVNGMGNLCIFGIDGTATVQVVDVTGRMLSSETFSGSYERKLNVAPGVYMIRLINGNDVKVQKMIVK